MESRVARTVLIATLTALALLPGLWAEAGAEQVKKGNLIASFHGAIAPLKLPRHELAPVSVQMGGKIKTSDRSIPPKLDRIVIGINSNGKIDATGLPTCSLAQLNSISAAAARRTCGGAMIGHGNVTSRVTLPGQGAFASNGSLLAFNGRYKGRAAVFAQVASGAPLPLTYVIVFEIERGAGTFGTSLVGTLPPIASEYGYISAFDLSLGRTYRFHGREMSYASADCPAPAGFSAAVFPFAKASYEFADGRVLSSRLVRQCKVKGR
jgi:hypothetical protein